MNTQLEKIWDGQYDPPHLCREGSCPNYGTYTYNYTSYCDYHLMRQLACHPTEMAELLLHLFGMLENKE